MPSFFYRKDMSGPEMNKNAIVVSLIVLVGLFVVYQYDPTFFGLMRSFEGFKTDNEATKESRKEAKVKAMDDKADADSALNRAKKFMNMDGFADPPKPADKPADKPAAPAAPADKPAAMPADKKEGFADLKAYEGTADFGSADAPAGCYPRDQLTPSELLPRDMNSIWAEQNPMGPGSLKGKNFLSAGALIGVNTVGQSLRNANLQVRSEPPNPQVAVSIFNQSTIAPDISHRPLEIGS